MNGLIENSRGCVAGLLKRLRLRAGVSLLAVLSVAAMPLHAEETTTVRVGVLKFGTVNWELNTVMHHGFDAERGISLEVVPFAGGDATRIALLGGEVDVIVSDWLWVSRQRADGLPLTFVPYSSSVGAIMVPPDSPVKSLADLSGKSIGVAGGPLDKSWLLLQGHARQAHDLDLAGANEAVFGAPPLLAEQARSGDLDAVLNYWHYCARLEAEGFTRLISAEQAATALGASGPTSAIGYVFNEEWANDNPAVEAFINASRDAKALLRDSDDEWQRLADSGAIKDSPEALIVLRDRFREGIPVRPLNDEIRDAEVVYQLLEDLGGEKLVGDSKVMVDGTYWEGPGSGS